ncbi:MAG: hypothetical protein AABX11_07675 [Nanoarchaeota archaeon]
MELNLYIKDGADYRLLKVPSFIVRNLVCDRLSKSELDRINRFAEKTRKPEIFKAGSIVIDFKAKTAECFQIGLRLGDIEPTWNIEEKEMTLFNY